MFNWLFCPIGGVFVVIVVVYEVVSVAVFAATVVAVTLASAVVELDDWYNRTGITSA